MFQTKVAEKIKTHILSSITFVDYRAFYAIACKKIVKPSRPQMTLRRIRIACWIPKTTYARAEYVLLTDFPLPQ
jgi:hypothetical protein